MKENAQQKPHKSNSLKLYTIFMLQKLLDAKTSLIRTLAIVAVNMISKRQSINGASEQN